jgi:hypothetical protein
VILSLDHHGISPADEMLYSTINDSLTYCFMAELVIKILGLGFTAYLRDNYNVFDAIIVAISVVEKILMATDAVANTGAFSVLRGFRLLRVFKLARSWKSFHQLL